MVVAVEGAVVLFFPLLLCLDAVNMSSRTILSH